MHTYGSDKATGTWAGQHSQLLGGSTSPLMPLSTGVRGGALGIRLAYAVPGLWAFSDHLGEPVLSGLTLPTLAPSCLEGLIGKVNWFSLLAMAAGR